MTGPEKETLTVLLRLLETVQSDIHEVKDAVKAIDTRVQAMERKDVVAVTTAATTATIAAASAARNEKRSLSLRAWVAIAVTGGAALISLALKIIEILQPHSPI